MVDLVFDELQTQKEKKKLNIKFHCLTKKANIKMTEKTKLRIEDCGTFLEFLSDKEYKNFRLSGANFCENRFCPNCNYNFSRKLGVELAIICKYIKEKYDYNFLFLTLTAPNINEYDLNDELKNYYKSCEKLFKRKEIKKITRGYIRKLEVTYNSSRNDYHPHYHILIAVDKSYFTSRNYISRDRWLELWQQCKNDLSITQVDIQKVNDDNLLKSLLELSKYLSKDSDYLFSKHVFEVFYKNLKGKRIISFSDCFKEARILYKAGELDYLKEVDQVDYIYKIYYLWKNFDYSLNNIIELSEEEKEQVFYKL